VPLQGIRLVLRGKTRRCSEQQKQAGKPCRHLDFPASVATLATMVVIVTPASLNDRRRRMAAGPRVPARPSHSLLSLVFRDEGNNMAALLASERCQFRVRTKPRLPAMQFHDSAARLATRRHQLDIRRELHFVAVRRACGRFLFTADSHRRSRACSPCVCVRRTCVSLRCSRVLQRSGRPLLPISRDNRRDRAPRDG
jgi:hypothetical protein